MQVPLLDIKAQLQTIEEELKSAVLRVVEEGHYILGPEVRAFEKEAATYLNVKHAIGVASGTDALLLSLKALNIGSGDEVITTPYSFFATAGTITNVGGTPVFVDIDRKTYNIDPQLIEAKITDRTKAIIPVHLFGQCADMPAIMRLAKKYDLIVIEDAAQAFGAEQGGQKAGTIGQLGCFSFFPSKNLGGLGDAGMVTTNDDELAEKVRMLRVHGSRQKHYHDIVGTNSRLDTIQAAALLVKLKYLDQWNRARRERATFYNEAFSVKEYVTPPYEEGNNFHIYNQYVVRLQGRDELVNHLKENKIECAIYYPWPLHLQTCFRYLNYQPGDLPESEAAARETLSIPVYPELTQQQQKYVVEKIEQFFISSRIKESLFGFTF